MPMIFQILNIKIALGLLRRWLRGSAGSVITEAALIFPVMLSLLMGVWDMGSAMVINQRVINAAQTTADVLTRKETASPSDRDQAIAAARRIMENTTLHDFDPSDFGYDIATVEFDSDGDPQVRGRETDNMTPTDIDTLNLNGLGTSGEGLIVVTIQYEYEPVFTNFAVDTINYEEMAFARGREKSFVEFTS